VERPVEGGERRLRQAVVLLEDTLDIPGIPDLYLPQRLRNAPSILAVVARRGGLAAARDAADLDLEDDALERVGGAAGDGEGAPGANCYLSYSGLQVRPLWPVLCGRRIVAGAGMLIPTISLAAGPRRRCFSALLKAC
jgi:hypothetical protein